MNQETIHADITITCSERLELQQAAAAVRTACPSASFIGPVAEAGLYRLRIRITELADIGPCVGALMDVGRAWIANQPTAPQAANIQVRRRDGEERPWHISVTL